MKIARINLLFPVWKMAVLVSIAQHRRATLFESVLVELIDRFREDLLYQNQSLSVLLDEVLCIPEGDAFVRPTLIQLIDRKVVHCKKPFRSLKGVSLKELTLSEGGKEMAQKGVVAGKTEDIALDVYVDPVIESLLADDSKDALTQEKIGRTFDIDIENVELEKIVRQGIQDLQPDWLNEENILLSVSLDQKGVFWQNRTGNLLIDGDGELHLEFGSQMVSDLLKKMSPQSLFETYLAPLLTTKDLSPQLPEEIHTPLESLSSPPERFMVPNSINDFFSLEQPGIHFLRYRDGIAEQIKLYDHTLLVVFEYLPEDQPQGIIWDEERNAAIVYLDEKFPMTHCWYLNHNRENIFLQNLQVKINGNSVIAPLGYALPGSDRCLDPTPFFELTAEILEASESSDYQLIKLFWKSPQAVFQDIYDQVKKRAAKRNALMEELGDYRRRIRKIRPESTLRTIDLDP